jgi:hypothetical protein
MWLTHRPVAVAVQPTVDSLPSCRLKARAKSFRFRYVDAAWKVVGERNHGRRDRLGEHVGSTVRFRGSACRWPDGGLWTHSHPAILASLEADVDAEEN